MHRHNSDLLQLVADRASYPQVRLEFSQKLYLNFGSSMCVCSQAKCALNQLCFPLCKMLQRYGEMEQALAFCTDRSNGTRIHKAALGVILPLVGRTAVISEQKQMVADVISLRQ